MEGVKDSLDDLKTHLKPEEKENHRLNIGSFFKGQNVSSQEGKEEGKEDDDGDDDDDDDDDDDENLNIWTFFFGRWGMLVPWESIYKALLNPLFLRAVHGRLTSNV